jgi:hypothetical protein
MLSDAAVRARKLDDRASGVLAHIDGRRTVTSIVGRCEIPSAEVLAVLVDLTTRGVIAFR